MASPKPLPLIACATLAMVVSACGPAPTDPGPGGVTVEEAKALDQAAEKLEAEQANPPLLPEASKED
jgi:hypothetical protein